MWYEKSVTDVIEQLHTNPEEGLTQAEVAARQQRHGPNAFAPPKKQSIWQLLFAQINSPLIYILLAAAIISAIVGELSDAVIIGLVIALNAVIGVIQEAKAEQSLAALQKLSTPQAVVRRDGETKEVPSELLVPGDIVLIDAGRYVPADLRLLKTTNFKVEESALTGESVPVDKRADWSSSEEVPLGDQQNMAFMSTLSTYGRATGVVVATGMATEIGKIAGMLGAEAKDETPLQRRLASLGKTLGIGALIVCAVIFALGYWQGREPLDMFLLAVSLAVAAIPEGLPAIVTIVLALGVRRMIKRHAIVRKLPAVETLGSVTVICSDKTGTLTQNKMTVVRYAIGTKAGDIAALNSRRFAERRLLEHFSLCNDATYTATEQTGDPTEVALLAAAATHDIHKESLERATPRVHEIPFDSERKRMTTVHRSSHSNDDSGKYVVIVKGAIERVLPRAKHAIINDSVVPLTDDGREAIAARANDMSEDALRVLATAYKEVDTIPERPEDLESDLIFSGFVGMIDPPREEVKDALAACKRAGIKTVMITGDHKVTAVAIARELGMAHDAKQAITGAEIDDLSAAALKERVPDLAVFARVSPEHKVRIVEAYKANGHIVSMTGDGVNDAPSLKRADIGVAMGVTGTDVAKGAADIVLTDDNFSTIVAAVAEGRNIYRNVKKAILFLLSCNVGELIALFFAIMLGWPAPLRAIHILWVNLITDTLPAISLGVDPGSPDVMDEKPRRQKAGIFAGSSGIFTVGNGLLIGALTLVAFLMSVKMYSGAPSLFAVDFDNLSADALAHAQTMAFVVLSVSQLFHALNLRHPRRPLWQIGLFGNKLLLGSIALGIAIQAALVNLPFFQDVFHLHRLSASDWLLALLLSLVPLALNELGKLFASVKRRKL